MFSRVRTETCPLKIYDPRQLVKGDTIASSIIQFITQASSGLVRGPLSSEREKVTRGALQRSAELHVV